MTAKPLNILSAQLNPRMGDFDYNASRVQEALQSGKTSGVDLIVFPELFITGYPPEDLIFNDAFIDKAIDKIDEIHASLTPADPILLIGTPYRNPRNTSEIFNAIAILEAEKPLTFRAKTELPNYGVFDEKRTFTPAPLQDPWVWCGISIGLPICEDIWHPHVAKHLKSLGAELLIVPNGSPFEHHKHEMRRAVITARQHETGLPIIYNNRVGGQDELVFDGDSFAQNSDGTITGQSPLFQEALTQITIQKTSTSLTLTCNKAPPKPTTHDQNIYTALVLGLRDYIAKTGFTTALLGLSGGIDSALVAAIAVDALGAENVRAFMLPYDFTSEESLKDAKTCAQNLGINYESVPIAPAVTGFHDMLTPFSSTQDGITFENLQSRTRGTLLMALSNLTGAMLLTTGNKSEMAVGYATIYGDMNGGFNPIKDLYKTKVFALATLRNSWKPDIAKGPAPTKDGPIPNNIITKPPTAELKADQKDTDSLPPYDTLDSILTELIEHKSSAQTLIQKGYAPETVTRVSKLLNIAEYKRRQAAPGIKVTPVNFGRDWRYPIAKKIDLS